MADLDDLLARSSRTFALAIPLLPAPPRREVTLAYLLLRIADTFEDATRWDAPARIAALHGFADALEPDLGGTHQALAERWWIAPPCDHAGYLALIAAWPEVMKAVGELPSVRRGIVLRHVRRVALGMSELVHRGRANGELVLVDEADLRGYCYVVAGIVGELLTELFLDAVPSLAAVTPVLHAHAAAFGEGLQLVNILKDAEVDARDRRTFLPRAVGRRGARALALADLERATTYIHALHHAGAPRGIVTFCSLPVLLARATLDAIDRAGAGAKISRAEVMALLRELTATLDRGDRPLGEACIEPRWAAVAPAPGDAAVGASTVGYTTGSDRA